MIPYKKGLSTLREDGPTQFSIDVTRWALNNIEMMFVENLDTLLISREDLQQSANEICNYSEEEEIALPPWTETFSPSDYKLINRIPDKKYNIEQPFVANIHGGKVLNHTGMCATQNYSIILDSGKSGNPLGKRVSPAKTIGNKICNISRGNSDHDYETATALTSIIRPQNDSNFTNLYVWVHNYLPKLQGIEHWSDHNKQNPKIIIPKHPPSWVIESLEVLGYSDHIVFWDPKDQLSIKNLLVPSNRRVERYSNPTQFKFLSPNACTWLREKATNQINSYESEFSNKIFISRSDAGRRELINRDQIVDQLENQGFISYELSNMSFEQQIMLFSQADQIVGAHGAGLVNMIFSSDCTITEIFGDKLMPTYYLLANSCNHKYQAVSGQSVCDPDISLHNQDIRVDPEVIIRQINKIE